MEGIREAIEYISNQAVRANDPKVIEADGHKYTADALRRVDKPPMAAPIKATTLTALVSYIRESRAEFSTHERMIIHVVSPTKVLFYSGLLAERDRETLFETSALLPRFSYGQEYPQEDFLIAMQSCFLDTVDRQAVLMMTSNITNTQSAQYSDDGISQQATIRTGITTKENAIVPNPVELAPYRTFLEVEQPTSEFTFRISEGKGGEPRFKLVSADGGLWEQEAMQNIRKYLFEALAEIPDRQQITIIA